MGEEWVVVVLEECAYDVVDGINMILLETMIKEAERDLSGTKE